MFNWRVMVLASATVAFGCAMLLRGNYNPWLTNGAVAAAAIVAVAALSRTKTWPSVTLVGVSSALALGAVLVTATHGLFALGVHLFPELGAHVQQMYGELNAVRPPMPITLALVLLVVIGEEVVWRVVAWHLASQRLRPVQTVLVTAGLYALPQIIGGSIILTVAALGLGMVLGVQRWCNQSPVPPLLTHMVWSTTVFVLWPLV